jgi:hypothetical protein
METTSYELQQGFANPREPGEYVWTQYDVFAYLDQAEAAAESLKGKWRIVSHTVELESE